MLNKNKQKEVNKLKKVVLFIVLLMALTGCVKEEITPKEEIPSEIKPAPGKELPEPLEEIKEGIIEEVEKPEEEVVEEAPKEEEEKVVYIKIKKFEFVPSELTIKKGTRVIWNNVDDKAHIFKQVGKGFRSPIIKAGETFEHTFNETEVFKYTEFNYGQRGKIIII